MSLPLKKPESDAGSAVPATLIRLFVAFGGVLFGLVSRSLLEDKA
jgi:hypothetical protein